MPQMTSSSESQSVRVLRLASIQHLTAATKFQETQALRAAQYLYSYDPRVACIFPTSTAGKGAGQGLQVTIRTTLEKVRTEVERHVE